MHDPGPSTQDLKFQGLLKPKNMVTDQIKYNPVFHGVVAELQPFQDIEEMTEINLWDRQEQLGLVDEMGLKLLNFL